ncbi:MAG: peroxide stress protein YaaA [Hamadaea sp.]|nr:peroxide stress protein YaaA [Hamadaea sp.]NUR52565.1 peroxide stress protein YaaA [Hamadaea sp.]NUT05131.1 peroxide stress protein YaaA [Hamadaea sp.]
MFILLPPSEGKAAAGSGAAVDHDSLFLPQLRRPRERVLKALVKLCSAKSKAGQAKALATLGLSEGQRDELVRNAGLLTASTLPARQVYTGVLYDNLDLASLPPEVDTGKILVSSGLWGVVRLDDEIPPYRCSIGVSLPPVGGLTAYWKKALNPALDREVRDELVLDLRSGAYAATWTPRENVAVRVLQERDGKRTVVSHFNKATKGRLVRDLLLSGARPQTADELLATLRELKYTVEPAAKGFDIVVREL